MRTAKKRNWLIEARTRKGYRQKDVATLAGITSPAYNHYENGKRTPSPRIAEKIANILGVDKTLFFYPS